MTWDGVNDFLHFFFFSFSHISSLSHYRAAPHTRTSNHTTSCFLALHFCQPTSPERMENGKIEAIQRQCLHSFLFSCQFPKWEKKNENKKKELPSLEQKIKGAFLLCAVKRRAAGARRGWARQNGASWCVPRRVIKWVCSEWQKDISNDDDNGDEYANTIRTMNAKGKRKKTHTHTHTQTKWRQIAVKWFFKCVISR